MHGPPNFLTHPAVRSSKRRRAIPSDRSDRIDWARCSGARTAQQRTDHHKTTASFGATSSDDNARPIRTLEVDVPPERAAAFNRESGFRRARVPFFYALRCHRSASSASSVGALLLGSGSLLNAKGRKDDGPHILAPAVRTNEEALAAAVHLCFPAKRKCKFVPYLRGPR